MERNRQQGITDEIVSAHDYCRMVVQRWDEDYIYGTTSDGEARLQVSFDGAAEEGQDWRYLCNMLRSGSMLNLVRPHTAAGVTRAELMVLEPDYLVDISAIAACFESFSRSPLMHLLHRLQSSQSSSAIVLGNLASQFLDEELCLAVTDNTYSRSIHQFFREHTLPLLTTPLSQDFHEQAQLQKQNIRTALRQTLPSAAGTFHASDVMVEPSFFSEMLGIQGRMDFLQLDMRVLIEQKSGKGGFPQPAPDTPSYQLKHYVQLLLYMTLIRYNYRSTYEQNQGELQAFLLYSKYANGLLRAGFNEGLVYDAIRMRNGIVANEYDFRHRCLQPLSNLTPGQCNTLGSQGLLWQRYQQPQLEALLAPIQAASSLEQAYYMRMLEFVQTEHMLAKVGHLSGEGRASFADKWYSSLNDKLAMGNIHYQLEMVYPQPYTEGKIDRIVMRRHDTLSSDVSNFRRGDIVILYAYPDGREPDARSTMVFRCTLAEINDDTITLLMRSSQTDVRVLYRQNGEYWAIEHDFFEASFASLYRGLHALLSAPKQRRDLLMLQRKPDCDTSRCLKGDYQTFNELTLRTLQAKDFFLIIGPPGTGKTSFGLINTLKEELLNPGSSVLLMAYTNRAVDEICGKLVEEGIAYLRLGSSLSCEDIYKPYLLSTVAASYSNIASLRREVMKARVVVGTTTSLNSFPAFFSLHSFSLAIIDEASQILEPHLMGLFAAMGGNGLPAIAKFVMIGDHKQLPAVVQQSPAQSAVKEPLLRSIGLTDCRLSLFERLLRAYRDNPQVVYQLTRQGRMHPVIADFPNRQFYGGALEIAGLPHQLTDDCPPMPASVSLSDVVRFRRVTFIDVEPLNEDIGSKVNNEEARLIADMVVGIYRDNPSAFEPQHTVGVIVPYRNQIAAVRSAIMQHRINLLANITIDTVERFQGSQRDTIIYGCTVSHPTQLAFLTETTFEEDGMVIDRKLNVAMTRAMRHLAICGYAKLLRTNDVYAKLMDRFSLCETSGNDINFPNFPRPVK
ncbi:MAG: AAA family ATPase [Bacteroidaceae bacterium]|nr:AAA family ATPase [Bacteroidaceae bacterium]